MEKKDLEKRTKDERIPHLIADVDSFLNRLKAILDEKYEKLDNMSNSEWGSPEGQKLEGQANRLTYAEMFLEDCRTYLIAAKEFDE